jgi:hypothetical protein
MIVPIHGLRYYNFAMPQIDDFVTLVKEKNNIYDYMAIAAYNSKNQKFGYVSAKSSKNQKVYTKMLGDEFLGKVWAVYQNQILVELDFQTNLPQKNSFPENR